MNSTPPWSRLRWTQPDRRTVPAIGADGFAIFAVMSIMITLSLVPVSLGDRSNPAPPEDVKLDLGRVWRISPLGAIGCIAIGVTNSAFRTLSPVYAEAIGMSVANVVVFVSVGIIGGALMQYPLGYLSDRWDRRKVLLLTTMCALGSALALATVGGTDPMTNFILVFVFGSFAMPLFSLSAAHANDRSDFVTVDTEFIRETTFWPILCLIQMAAPGVTALVDPLAKGIDLAPFYRLMGNERVTKVFHAARQDIEIIHHQGGLIPHPLFDTQVAAMVCGFGDSVSYEQLVQKVTGGRIDKSSRFTDWRRRPLTDKQLEYALADVTHLIDIYRHLVGELERENRAHWLKEEMAVLTAPATYDPTRRTPGSG
jgi:hypothetical protein